MRVPSKLALSLCIILTLMAGKTFAGSWIATGVTITSVSNTAGNQDVYEITFSGGSTTCGSNTIAFPDTAIESVEARKRAYSLAMLAFNTGKPVDIYSYVGSGSCWDASYIKIQH